MNFNSLSSKTIAGRKATSGSILVPVPKQGLWWHLSLYIQLLACIPHTVMLSFPRALSFPGGSSSLSPWGTLAQRGQSSSLLRQQWSPNQVPCSGFQRMAQGRGAPHWGLPRALHVSSRHARENRKTKLIVLSNSASQDSDLCRAQSKNPKIWAAEMSAPLLCCSQSGLWCRPWAGVMGDTKLIKWSDHMTTGHCKGEELLIPLCLTRVTYTLWLWHWHLLILFSNLLHKLANQMVSFNSPLNKEASLCTGNKLYLTSTQFEDQKEVCLTLLIIFIF